MGQGNTVVSHFVVQRANLIVAIACVPCSPRHSLIYACEWGFWVCWKLSAAEQIKPDCCHTPAVVSNLLTPLPGSLSFYAPPPNYNYYLKWLGYVLLLWKLFRFRSFISFNNTIYKFAKFLKIKKEAAKHKWLNLQLRVLLGSSSYSYLPFLAMTSTHSSFIIGAIS